MNRICNILLLLSVLTLSCRAQGIYWNSHTCLVPWRLPLASPSQTSLADLDGDGNPDVLRTVLPGDLNAIWIDDDNDMQWTDTEGDSDNDCLCVDVNRDGLFGGPGDICIDWVDNDGDGLADMQFVVCNGFRSSLTSFDDSSDFICLYDWGEKDGRFNFIDWNEIALRCWEHSGHGNFFEDYHGNTLLLKMHSPSYRIDDHRYCWENPFVFYDFDHDGLSEMAIRMVDTPYLRYPWHSWPADRLSKSFAQFPDSIEVSYSHRIDWVSMAWDLDNDNGQGNELDFDMTLLLRGTGFDYSDQVHHFPEMRGNPAADSLVYDPRWRQRTELIFPHQEKAYDLIWQRGNWSSCYFVFDEDDDCNRWERVELYQPLDPFKTGRGGMDQNMQSDAVGDRGEFDEDFSGGGRLYISPVDGRIHLFGAEWGAWRIDQKSAFFQGYGGIYPPSLTKNRLHASPKQWATLRYSDSDGNGFFDLVEYDLDGYSQYEDSISLLALGIDDRAPLFDSSKSDYREMRRLFRKSAQTVWQRAQQAIAASRRSGLSTSWYVFYSQPHTLAEQYSYGCWLTFYLYRDLYQHAILKGDADEASAIRTAYCTGIWNKVGNVHHFKQ